MNSTDPAKLAAAARAQLAEAETLLSLRHERVLVIHGLLVDDAGKMTGLVTEHASDSLTGYLDAMKRGGRRLALRELLKICLHTLQGLNYLHLLRPKGGSLRV